MKILVYNKEIVFTDEEINIINKAGLDLDSEFMELILHWNGIDRFDSDDMKINHLLCIDAIESYADIVIKTLTYIEKG